MFIHMLAQKYYHLLDVLHHLTEKKTSDTITFGMYGKYTYVY